MPVPMTGRMQEGKNSERGAALILVAVLLVFAGYILTLGLGRFGTSDTQDKVQMTAKRQQLLVSELSAYAQRENKIPCPADPSVAQTAAGFGFARNASSPNIPAAGPDDAGACDTNTDEGIVPFRTLGLEPYDAMDGWGRFMTYRISPVMANPVSGTTAAAANIFMRCRRFPWYDDGEKVLVLPIPPNPAYFNTSNVYPDKAMFCCPPDNGNFVPATDMQMFLTAGTPVPNIGRTVNVDNKLITTDEYYAQIPAADGTQEVPAFAIISHGANGLGAFKVDGTAGRRPGAVGDEALNATFAKPLRTVAKPMNLATGPNYFDDMVIWRTQITLISELNNASCYMPWR